MVDIWDSVRAIDIAPLHSKDVKLKSVILNVQAFGPSVFFLVLRQGAVQYFRLQYLDMELSSCSFSFCSEVGFSDLLKSLISILYITHSETLFLRPQLLHAVVQCLAAAYLLKG